MKDIPQKMKEVITHPRLRETVQHQPGSLRFKATVLGLVSLAKVKDEADGELPKDRK